MPFCLSRPVTRTEWIWHHSERPLWLVRGKWACAIMFAIVSFVIMFLKARRVICVCIVVTGAYGYRLVNALDLFDLLLCVYLAIFHTCISLRHPYLMGTHTYNKYIIPAILHRVDTLIISLISKMERKFTHPSITWKEVCYHKASPPKIKN